jgi:cytidine deaminase
MNNCRLSNDDIQLIEQARTLVRETKVSGGIVKEVGSALVTNGGRVFTGANLDLWCGIGFCAEHSAIANMISHSSETQIRTIVAHNGREILYPCGRCRELMELIDVRNREYTDIIISDNQKVKLKELLPGEWMPRVR